MSEFFKDILAFINTPFGSSIAGGLIGGLFTFLGVSLSMRANVKSNLLIQKREVNSFCKAIMAELQCLHDRYMATMGSALGEHPVDEPFLYHYTVTEQYFTVFNTNANFLGKVSDDDLRSQIISTYTSTKGHMDSLRMNTTLYLELKEIKNHEPIAAGSSLEVRKNNLIQSLRNYSNMLRLGHHKLMDQMISTIQNLKTYEEK